MSDCYMHEFQSYAIGLRLLSTSNEDLGWAANVMDVIDELKDICQPTSAYLIIRCRNKEIKWVDNNVKVSLPYWFICQSTIPESIVLKSGFEKAQISQVPELSRKIIMDWIEKALQQDCGVSETHEPGWYTLFFTGMRVRIFNERNISNESTLFVNAKRAGDLKYPLEKRHDGYWVYAPIKHYTTQLPLSLEVINTEGSLHITIPVNWSLWSTPGTAENTALREALSRIANKGWDLTHIQDVFQI